MGDVVRSRRVLQSGNKPFINIHLCVLCHSITGSGWLQVAVFFLDFIHCVCVKLILAVPRYRDIVSVINKLCTFSYCMTNCRIYIAVVRVDFTYVSCSSFWRNGEINIYKAFVTRAPDHDVLFSLLYRYFLQLITFNKWHFKKICVAKLTLSSVRCCQRYNFQVRISLQVCTIKM